MTAINYPRHFALLGCAAIIFGVMLHLNLPLSNRRQFFFGFVGALHAISLVAALNIEGSALKRMTFVGVTAASSIAAMYFGLGAMRLLSTNAATAAETFLFFSSAGGAAVYWLLVKTFWLQGLHAKAVLVTVGLCVSVTMLALLYGKTPQIVRSVAPTLLWWLGFSISLLISETRFMAPDSALGQTRSG